MNKVIDILDVARYQVETEKNGIIHFKGYSIDDLSTACNEIKTIKDDDKLFTKLSSLAYEDEKNKSKKSVLGDFSQNEKDDFFLKTLEKNFPNIQKQEGETWLSVFNRGVVEDEKELEKMAETFKSTNNYLGIDSPNYQLIGIQEAAKKAADALKYNGLYESLQQLSDVASAKAQEYQNSISGLTDQMQKLTNTVKDGIPSLSSFGQKKASTFYSDPKKTISTLPVDVNQSVTEQLSNIKFILSDIALLQEQSKKMLHQDNNSIVTGLQEQIKILNKENDESKRDSRNAMRVAIVSIIISIVATFIPLLVTIKYHKEDQKENIRESEKEYEYKESIEKFLSEQNEIYVKTENKIEELDNEMEKFKNEDKKEKVNENKRTN